MKKLLLSLVMIIGLTSMTNPPVETSRPLVMFYDYSVYKIKIEFLDHETGATELEFELEEVVGTAVMYTTFIKDENAFIFQTHTASESKPGLGDGPPVRFKLTNLGTESNINWQLNSIDTSSNFGVSGLEGNWYKGLEFENYSVYEDTMVIKSTVPVLVDGAILYNIRLTLYGEE